MSNITDSITGFVAGDDLEVNRTITDIPSGQTLTTAWFTAKTAIADADPGLFQKVITSANVIGTGQITDTGADGTGAVRFDLVPADTALLVPANSTQSLFFDIQVKLSSGKIYTPVSGRVRATAQVTRATS